MLYISSFPAPTPFEYTHGFENIPCVSEEKSKSLPFCVEDADGRADADCGFVVAEGATPFPVVYCPMP